MAIAMPSRSEILFEEMRHINPDTMYRSPAFSQVIEVTGPVRTIYIGGQDAVDRTGNIIGIGDIEKQAEQVVKNLQSALKAADAGLEHLVKCTIYLVQGQPVEPGYQAFRRVWGERKNPPTVTFLYVAGLARPEFLLEIDAIAAAPIP